MSRQTPWGPSQSSTRVAEGITMYFTEGHGGLHVAHALNSQIPGIFRSDTGWYEEDCEWSIVFFFLEAHILSTGDAHAKGLIERNVHMQTFVQWYPAASAPFLPTAPEAT